MAERLFLDFSWQREDELEAGAVEYSMVTIIHLHFKSPVAKIVVRVRGRQTSIKERGKEARDIREFVKVGLSSEPYM
jgi:hypothetical protein